LHQSIGVIDYYALLDRKKSLYAEDPVARVCTTASATIQKRDHQAQVQGLPNRITMYAITFLKNQAQSAFVNEAGLQAML
jgi:hypothetical protein